MRRCCAKLLQRGLYSNLGYLVNLRSFRPPPHNICPNIIIQNIEGLCTSSPLGTDLSQSRLRSKSYGTIILHPPTSFSKPRHPIFSQQKITLRAFIKKFAFRSTDPLVFLLLPLLAALFIIREDFTLAEFLLTKINGLPTDYILFLRLVLM